MWGLTSFYACEKDEDKATLDSNPTAPTLQVSDITLERSNAGGEVTISGSDADFGFKASVTYRLEADIAGSDFANAITVASGSQNAFTFTVSELNTIFLGFLPEDQTTSVDMRVVADLGVPSDDLRPTVVNSATSTINVTTYGPPKLSFTTAEQEQKVVSPGGDGVYSGWLYTDGTGFTLTDDNGVTYGRGGEGVLVEGGDPFTFEAGAYNMTVDVNSMSYSYADVTIGLIGDAVGGWDFDTKMIWDFTDQTWNAYGVTVIEGGIKFRTHNTWNEVNVAYDPDGHDLNNLYQANSREGAGDSQNIDDIAPGTYDIKFYLNTTPMKAVFTPVGK